MEVQERNRRHRVGQSRPLFCCARLAVPVHASRRSYNHSYCKSGAIIRADLGRGSDPRNSQSFRRLGQKLHGRLRRVRECPWRRTGSQLPGGSHNFQPRHGLNSGKESATLVTCFPGTGDPLPPPPLDPPRAAPPATSSAGRYPPGNGAGGGEPRPGIASNPAGSGVDPASWPHGPAPGSRDRSRRAR